MLHLMQEDPHDPPARIHPGTQVYHHTIVALDQQPSDHLLSEYLFHLRRAYGQTNRPPPPPMPTHGAWSSSDQFDRILRHRYNRFHALSREGLVCITWPSPAEQWPPALSPSSAAHSAGGHSPAHRRCTASAVAFHAEKWPSIFQRLYCLLVIQVLAEACVLSELSAFARYQVRNLRLESPHTTLYELHQSRTQLRMVVAAVCKYSMSLADPGCIGSSELSHFFLELRGVLEIPVQRESLRNLLHDVLSIVESGYMEETRRKQDREQKERELGKRIRRHRQRLKDHQKHRTEVACSVLGALTLPILLIASVYGMNVDDLPDVPFWAIMFATAAFSIVSICAFLLGKRLFNLVERRLFKRTKLNELKIAKREMRRVNARIVGATTRAGYRNATAREDEEEQEYTNHRNQHHRGGDDEDLRDERMSSDEVVHHDDMYQYGGHQPPPPRGDDFTPLLQHQRRSINATSSLDFSSRRTSMEYV